MQFTTSNIPISINPPMEIFSVTGQTSLISEHKQHWFFGELDHVLCRKYRFSLPALSSRNDGLTCCWSSRWSGSVAGEHVGEAELRPGNPVLRWLYKVNIVASGVWLFTTGSVSCAEVTLVTGLRLASVSGFCVWSCPGHVWKYVLKLNWRSH